VCPYLHRRPDQSIDHNTLSELPDEFGSRLSRLRSVNLSGNHFGEVPRQIVGMPALEQVDLSANFIVGIDDDAREALLRMPRLRQLDVSENPVAEQPLPAALRDLLTTRQDQDQ
jgi:Leucine-rich repeat (LRR) protein